MSKNQQKTIPQKGKPNAAQRIFQLEQSVQAINNSIQELAGNIGKALTEMNRQSNERMGIIADEIDKLNNSIRDVRKRVDATIEATDSNDQVSQKLVSIAVKEMEEKVSKLVELGALVETPDVEVTDRTFLVGREVDKEGNEVNPRLQFAVTQKSIPEETRAKVLGAKLGDVISFSDDEKALDFEITKIYTIQEVDKKFDEEQSLEEDVQLEEQA